MAKIQVVMCPAERAPYVTNIENTLENFQNTVGGYIEAVGIATDCVAIMNEEGRIKGLPENLSFPWPGHHGDIFFCGVDGEEFTSIPAAGKKLLLKSARCRWADNWEKLIKE